MKARIIAICLFMPIIDSLVAGEKENLDSLILKLNNREIAWEGDFAGLRPSLIGENLKKVIAYGEESIPLLLKCVEDPNKSIACHVMLTFLSKKRFEYSSTHWNGLRITLHANGETEVNAKSLEGIVKNWKEYERVLSNILPQKR